MDDIGLIRNGIHEHFNQMVGAEEVGLIRNGTHYISAPATRNSSGDKPLSPFIN